MATLDYNLELTASQMVKATSGDDAHLKILMVKILLCWVPVVVISLRPAHVRLLSVGSTRKSITSGVLSTFLKSLTA